MPASTLALSSANYELLDALGDLGGANGGVFVGENEDSTVNSRLYVKGDQVNDFNLALGSGNSKVDVFAKVSGGDVLLGQGNDYLDLREGITGLNESRDIVSDNETFDNSFDSQIDGGAGNDTIRIGGDVVDSRIYLGEGNDSLTVLGSSSNVYVSGDKGNDFVEFRGEINDNVVMQSGSGADTVIFSGSNLTNSAIELGVDNDLLILSSDINDTEINSGDGEDTLRISGQIDSTTIYNSGGDDLVTLSRDSSFENSVYSSTSGSSDTLILGTGLSLDNSNFYLGDENDYISLGSEWISFGSLISLGDGADTFVANNSVDSFFSDLSLDLGANDDDVDRLYFDSSDTFDSLVITGVGDEDILYIGSVEYEYGFNSGNDTITFGNQTWSKNTSA